MTKVGKAGAGEDAEEGMALMRGMLIAVCAFLRCLAFGVFSSAGGGALLAIFALESVSSHYQKMGSMLSKMKLTRGLVWAQCWSSGKTECCQLY
jgi:hypothetical protein